MLCCPSRADAIQVPLSAYGTASDTAEWEDEVVQCTLR
jgi:hypothetical protein